MVEQIIEFFINYIMPNISTTGVLIRIHIVGKQKAYGWLIGLCAQINFLIYIYLSKNYGFLLGNLLFIVMETKNYIQWKKMGL
jgi:hypothetical protein